MKPSLVCCFKVSYYFCIFRFGITISMNFNKAEFAVANDRVQKLMSHKLVGLFYKEFTVCI